MTLVTPLHHDHHAADAPVKHILNNMFHSQDQGIRSIFQMLFETYLATHHENLPVGNLYSLVMNEIEQPLIQMVLKHCGHNQKKAAEILGINRNTLRKKLLIQSD